MIGRDTKFSYWDIMMQIMHPMALPDELEKMGVVTKVDGAGFTIFRDAESPRYFEQQRIMDGLWRLLSDQFFQFIMGFNHFTAGYPSHFALLLEDDKELVRRARRLRLGTTPFQIPSEKRARERQ